MGKIANLSFCLWIGLAKRIIFAVDGLRSGRNRAPVPPPCTVPSGPRRLLGHLVQPQAQPIAATLLFHGIGDRIGYWSHAQAYLAQHNIASLVFHYSGYAGSTGLTTPANLHQDAHAAYAYLRAQLPGTPIFLLGFSMGTGIAADAAPTLAPPPAGLILAQAFPSFRSAAAEVVRPFRFLRYLVPDIWPTAAHLHPRQYPVLIIHSDADELFPLTMAHALYTAASLTPGAELAIPTGHGHNAIYVDVPPDYWLPILKFIDRNIRPNPATRKAPR